MRVLVISHPCTMKPYRRKFEILAERYGVDIRLVLPRRWIENFRELRFEGDLNPNSLLEICPRPIIFPGYTSRFLYTRGLVPFFRDFRPDIIHLEEEPWSMSALQAVTLKRIFCPQSRFIFRTSLSIWVERHFSKIPYMIERRVFRETDLAFALNEGAVRILRRKGYTGPTYVLPNGVDTRIFKRMDVSDLKGRLGLSSNFVIGYVGRLLWMKGVHTLIEAASKLDFDFQLMILGRGDYKGDLVRLAEKLGVSDRIVWIDVVPADEVPRYMNCLDVLVLPSLTTPHWVEFFGRVLVEAMACEVAVVGSDSGDIPNVVGDAGLIFREGDSDDLARKLKALRDSPSLICDLRRKGLRRALEFYSWEGIAERTHEIYRQLLNYPPEPCISSANRL
jgi:glycosyltransferase involved in cell wall biosynthesis